MSKTVAVILAGGRATRMGSGDKALLPLGDRLVMDHILARLSPQVGASVINTNGDPARWQGFGLDVVTDTIPNFAGPLSGVLSGLDWAHKKGALYALSVAADTPFFPIDLAARLHSARAKAKAQIAIAATEDASGKIHRHPTFGLWPVALRKDLRCALQNGARKVVAWADQYVVASAVFPAQLHDPFFNINTPEDLEKAQAMV